MPLGISRELPDKSITMFWVWGFFGELQSQVFSSCGVRLVLVTGAVVARLFHLNATVEMEQGRWEQSKL